MSDNQKPAREPTIAYAPDLYDQIDVIIEGTPYNIKTFGNHLLAWFIEQPRDVQLSIMGCIPPKYRPEIAVMVLQEMIENREKLVSKLEATEQDDPMAERQQTQKKKKSKVIGSPVRGRRDWYLNPPLKDDTKKKTSNESIQKVSDTDYRRHEKVGAGCTTVES